VCLEAQVGDLDDVDPLAAHDDLIQEPATGDDDVAALRIEALVSPAMDMKSFSCPDQFVGRTFDGGQEI
jgi:hypothetical protein